MLRHVLKISLEILFIYWRETEEEWIWGKGKGLREEWREGNCSWDEYIRRGLKMEEICINRKSTNEIGPSVNVTIMMKTVWSALLWRNLNLCIKQTVEQSYLETSHVHSETWARTPPVALPHFTWMTAVQSTLDLHGLVKKECIWTYESMFFLNVNNTPFAQQTQNLQKLEGSWNQLLWILRDRYIFEPQPKLLQHLKFCLPYLWLYFPFKTTSL